MNSHGRLNPLYLKEPKTPKKAPSASWSSRYPEDQRLWDGFAQQSHTFSRRRQLTGMETLLSASGNVWTKKMCIRKLHPQYIYIYIYIYLWNIVSSSAPISVNCNLVLHGCDWHANPSRRSPFSGCWSIQLVLKVLLAFLTSGPRYSARERIAWSYRYTCTLYIWYAGC